MLAADRAFDQIARGLGLDSFAQLEEQARIYNKASLKRNR
jgi:hypothetical protein